jgi:pyruvate kinase
MFSAGFRSTPGGNTLVQNGFAPIVQPLTRPVSSSHEESKTNNNTVRTKIICTIGPRTATHEMLTNLLFAGMNVARLNFSHGDHEYHGNVIRTLQAVTSRTRRVCAVMLDTKGPEIRTGKLKNGDEVSLKKGQDFILVADPDFVGDNTQVGVAYRNLPKVLNIGDTVLIDDGLISMTVEEIDQQSNTVKCKVNNDGQLGQTKGVNLPGVIVDLPAVTEKDVRDIQFGVKMGVDFIAASFVRKSSDVVELRRVLGEQGKNIKIIAKIENQEGLDNFDEILKEADGIMVARGDLGVEIPLEQVSIAQKMMITKSNRAGKFVITATQMLESMVKNPSPTRAEASDVANAVYDGTDCVMLSGETAKGTYPVEAVQVMVEICREAESCVVHLPPSNSNLHELSVAEAVASSAVVAGIHLKSPLIVVLTESGNSARLVSKFKPKAPILAITASDQNARQCMVSHGVFPLLVGSMSGSESLIQRCLVAGINLGMCKSGDLVIVISGAREAESGWTNAMTVEQVP